MPALGRLARRADPPPGAITARPHLGPRRRPEVGAADLEDRPLRARVFRRRRGVRASGSPTTTDGRRTDNSPRPWAGASACSTMTATAGLTSTVVQGDRFPPAGRPLADRRRPTVPQPGRRDVRGCDAARGDCRSSPGGYGHGVAVGDYDNDGRPDLFVTRWRSLRALPQPGRRHLRGRHGGAGLGGDRDWPTSAAFADLDGDGDLDLYVCHYLV